jgi:hypothetical protein
MMKSYSKAGTAAKTAKPAAATTAPKKKGVKTEEANEVAGFLLSLKNQRSVSPDPNDTPDAIATDTTTVPATATATGEASATSTTAPESTTAPTATSEAETPAVAAQTPIETTAVAATSVAADASSSNGVITGYAGPPPELTTFPGIPLVYPTSSYSYPSATAGMAGTESTLSTTPLKKINGKEKKLKKSLESGAIPTNNVAELQAMIDEFVEYDLTKFVDASNPLVQYKDRDLVPDALFVAMLQMKVCYLTQADRVGCYKTRDLGFVGMCCKHCNGQPGFGRYFPNSVRSLAQTTTSQTILKHIANKCRFCPPNIRDVVVELIRQQTIKEAAAAALTTNTIHNVISGASSGAITSANSTVTAGRPRYGSRKIFFHRVWSRLHAGTLGISTTDEDMEEYNMGDNDGDGDNYIPSSVIDDVVTEAMGESVAAAAAAAIKEQQDEEAAVTMATTATNNKRTLPLMGKNKKQKLEEESIEI